MNNRPKIDLMKIDTEATEHLVLEGAKDVLKRDEPVIICEVLKGITEKFLYSLLSNTGYKYFWILSECLVKKEQIEGDETYKNMNYLFITERKVQEIIKHSSADGSHPIFAKTTSRQQTLTCKTRTLEVAELEHSSFHWGPVTFRRPNCSTTASTARKLRNPVTQLFCLEIVVIHKSRAMLIASHKIFGLACID